MYNLPHVVAAALPCLGIAGFDPVTLALLIPAIIGLTILMRSTFRRSARSRSAQHVSARERFAADKEKKTADGDPRQVSIELDRFARHLMGQLDTRFAKLQEAIRLADDRIARLTALENRGPESAVEDATPVGQSSAHHPSRAAVNNLDLPIQKKAVGRTKQVESAIEVYRLADGGLAPPAIAERIGRPCGEVELMLALRRVQGEAGARRAPTTSAVSQG